MRKLFLLVVFFVAMEGFFAILPPSVMAKPALNPSGCCKRKPTKAELAIAAAAKVKKIAMVRAANKAAMERRIRVAKERVERLEQDSALAKSQGQHTFIRQSAVTALGGRPGTVVVSEVKTGKIVASVFQDWANSKEFHPCSTVKIATALAGLEAGVIDSNGLIVGETSKALKDMTLTEAIGRSNNWYFQSVGVKSSDKFLPTARKVGLGRETDFNVPSESPGRLPSAVTRNDEYSHAYNIRVTALQLNKLALAVANSDKQDAFGIPKEHWQRLVPGMIKATESDKGTARRSNSREYGLKLAGKTGTCQSTGAFTGFAPYDNPQYAFTVFVRDGGGGSAAEVAGKTAKSMKDAGLLAPQPQKAEQAVHNALDILQ